ncbi:MAG TPA: NAD(P)/FAD-dependent oxidoreductase [Anaerolineaceae bacterium]|nr:NAD(P)/FAD-dependent oxidoreductase [Anaerolineaceae bacterium]
MNEKIETIIVGGGQAGLATSYYLNQLGRENLVLDKAAQAGNAWRNDRWESFTLLTPNWSFRLPGAEYESGEPDAFMPRDEIVSRFENYVESFNLPVRYQQLVTCVEHSNYGIGYLLETEKVLYQANNVVVATGLFQSPKIPTFSHKLPADITQLHSGAYRNPALLPHGNILVIGSAQSGCQIAEELYLGGRKVFLSIGVTGRVPRRYRGKDVYRWMQMLGALDQTVDKLPSPQAKFEANPHVSGRDGGRTLNLHQFARDGVVLLGHLQDIQGNRIWFAPDRDDSLAKADEFEAKLVKRIDTYIEQQALNAPVETLPVLKDGFEREEILTLDLQAAGISTVIWAMGYHFDFSFVNLPVLDEDGFPNQTRGVTKFPGLYFVGLPWLYKYKSGHLLGVGEDAKYIAEVITRKTN